MCKGAAVSGDAGRSSNKSKALTYLLWLVGGVCGLHHFYLGRDLQGVLWWCTFGGYFGFGWLRDAFYIGEYVADANRDEVYMKKVDRMVRVHEKVNGNAYGGKSISVPVVRAPSLLLLSLLFGGGKILIKYNIYYTPRRVRRLLRNVKHSPFKYGTISEMFPYWLDVRSFIRLENASPYALDTYKSGLRGREGTVVPGFKHFRGTLFSLKIFQL